MDSANRTLLCRVAATLALACVVSVGRADVAGQLRLASEALERGDRKGALETFRRVLSSDDATAEEIGTAFDGLFAPEVVAGRVGDLTALVAKRREAAPEAQQPALIAALVRSLKARDGHLHGALAALAEEERQKHSSSYRLLREVRSLCTSVPHALERFTRQFAGQSLKRALQLARPARRGKGRVARPAALPEPTRPSYELRLVRLAAARRAPRSAKRVPHVHLRVPVVPRARPVPPASVVKPPAPRARSTRGLSAIYFSRAYQKATELAGQGFLDSAKAEYATVIQLFPHTSHAQQSARYALRLFQQQRGAAQHGEALTAYIRWIRAILGKQGSDYAEYLAFQSLAKGVDSEVIAREAEEFIKRHPESKYAPGIRLRLGVALDSIGDSRKAIEVLTPLAASIESSVSAKAAHVLAWLHVFQGDAANARRVLQRLAGQTQDATRADSARRLLKAMAAHPVPKIAVPELGGVDPPEEVLAQRVLEAADRCLRKGETERAMDLYTLYLKVGDDSPGYYAARNRIERLKQTGRVEE